MKKIFLLLFLFSLFFAIKVQAAKTVEFEPQVTIPGSQYVQGAKIGVNQNNPSAIAEYIIGIYNYVVGIVGLLGAIVIVFGGVTWLTSFGSSQKISDAKAWITSGITGIILALSAYLILSTINSNLVNFKAITISNITPQQEISLYKSQGTYFDPNAQLSGVVTKSQKLDNSGVQWCCVINGQKGTGSFDLSFRSGSLAPIISDCVTLESATVEPAEAKCKDFVKNYKSDGYYLTTRDMETFGRSLGKTYKSYEVSPNGCKDIPSVYSWCKGKDDRAYCVGKSDGDDCFYAAGDVTSYGYCSNGFCEKCKKYGEACSHDYECPNQSRASTKCGNSEVHTWSSDSSDCGADDVCDKEF